MTYKVNGIVHDISDHLDILFLPNTMHTIDRLRFDHRIPMGLHDMDRVCHGEVDTILMVSREKLNHVYKGFRQYPSPAAPMLANRMLHYRLLENVLIESLY